MGQDSKERTVSKSPGAQPHGGSVCRRYSLPAENSRASLPISDQIPALTAGSGNGHSSGRTPPLPGPQLSAWANCLSEAAGRECAGRNPSAEPDPAPAVGPRGAADHPQRGRPPCCALARARTPRETAHPEHLPEGARAGDAGRNAGVGTIQQCRRCDEAKCARGEGSKDFPGDSRAGGGSRGIKGEQTNSVRSALPTAEGPGAAWWLRLRSVFEGSNWAGLPF